MQFKHWQGKNYLKNKNELVYVNDTVSLTKGGNFGVTC